MRQERKKKKAMQKVKICGKYDLQCERNDADDDQRLNKYIYCSHLKKQEMGDVQAFKEDGGP